MKKYSKRIRELQTLITKESYSVQESIPLLKKVGTAKFVETAEAHVSLNIDPKYANQQLRTSLVLPNGTGKNIKIAVFSEPEFVDEALKMGATVAGSDDLLEDMTTGNLEPIDVDRGLSVQINPNTPSLVVLYIIRAY